MRTKKTTTTESVVTSTEENKEIKKPARKPRAPRKKKVEEPATPVTVPQPTPEPKPEPEPMPKPMPKPMPEPKPEPEPMPKPMPQAVTVPSLPNIEIHDIIDLLQAPQRSIILNDQQIQQLTLEEVEQRHLFLETALANVLDYDVVISDTNIWLELLVGHTSSHSDPRVNARLQFERQLEFISKIMKYRGGKFMMMGETYEEIDRFATMLDPQDHKDADWTDNTVCLNAAARLAKRLILSQQRENRLRIEGIGAESHHAAFADPAIVRRVVELFAEGKKVLLLTNDASVAIRSMGLCDDLQRYNNVSDKDWNEKHVPLRPMVFTFDDLKVLDYYTRQYHYIQMASGQPWMHTISQHMERNEAPALELHAEAFRPGDKHRSDNLFVDQKKPEQPKKQEQPKPQQKQQPKPQPKPQPAPQPKPQPAPQPKPQPAPQPKTEEPKVEQPKAEEPKPVRKPRRRPQRPKQAPETPKQPSEAPRTE